MSKKEKFKVRILYATEQNWYNHLVGRELWVSKNKHSELFYTYSNCKTIQKSHCELVKEQAGDLEIQVTKCKNKMFWYADYIGRTFSATRTENSIGDWAYSVSGSGLIYPEDCVVIEKWIPVSGERILVDLCGQWVEREFFAMDGKNYVCRQEVSRNDFCGWRSAKKIEKEFIVPNGMVSFRGISKGIIKGKTVLYYSPGHKQILLGLSDVINGVEYKLEKCPSSKDFSNGDIIFHGQLSIGSMKDLSNYNIYKDGEFYNFRNSFSMSFDDVGKTSCLDKSRFFYKVVRK